MNFGEFVPSLSSYEVVDNAGLCELFEDDYLNSMDSASKMSNSEANFLEEVIKKFFTHNKDKNK